MRMANLCNLPLRIEKLQCLQSGVYMGIGRNKLRNYQSPHKQHYSENHLQSSMEGRYDVYTDIWAATNAA